MTLTLTGVTVSRGIGPVVSDVNLQITPGDVTTLVGPNGAGKTSLLESISGIIGASAGSIELDGVNITKLSRRRRALIGLVHVEQGRMVFPSLTVRENIQLTSKRNSDFEGALELFPELGKRIDSPTMLLSGGEQQMVVLARAFAARPRYLLLDEMSLGLAPVVFLRLMPVVKKVAESGVGVLLVEQFAHLALRIAKDAVVLSGGRVSYQGPASDLAGGGDVLKRAYMG